MLWWHAPNIMSLFSHSWCCQSSIHSFFVTSSSFFGGERKHSHFPKLKSEKVKILTSPSIFADVDTKITIMENILHAFSLDKTEPEGQKGLKPVRLTDRAIQVLEAVGVPPNQSCMDLHVESRKQKTEYIIHRKKKRLYSY